MKYKELVDFADTHGLTVCKYNPGDNLTIKVFDGLGIDYFSGDGLCRAKTINEAYMFIKGYLCARYQYAPMEVNL